MLITGRALFANKTVAQQMNEQLMKLTKTCHAWGVKSGWNNAYIDTVWFPRMAAMEAAPKTQARAFHQPAKKPHGRPYLPAVIEAQWYTDEYVSSNY